jgi:HK97 gp10 family phage protein
MGIKIEGLEAVLDGIDEAVSVDRVEINIKKACAVVERAAKELAPKGTGELRRSITSRVENNGEDIVGLVYTPLEYAPYVEYGTGLFAENGGRKDVPWNYKDDEGKWHSTSGQHPQPFMRPALEDNRVKVMETLKEGVFG